jgi:O-antigen ligase
LKVSVHLSKLEPENPALGLRREQMPDAPLALRSKITLGAGRLMNRKKSLLQAGFVDRHRWASLADWLVIALAAALPWSTSAVSILVPLWIAALLPSLEFSAVRREVFSVVGGLPVLLWLFAGAGMLWADVPWAERFAWFGSFHKLLAIPLLLTQFRDSERSTWVGTAFLLSCGVLLAVSYFLAFWPGFGWRGTHSLSGVPVKDYVAQSGEFVLCAFALLPIAIGLLRARPLMAVGLCALAALFILNVFYVASGRTALVVIPVLVIVLAVRRFGWKSGCAVVLSAVIAGWLIWQSSTYLRMQMALIPGEIQRYSEENARTRIGERLEFWKKSFAFIAQAPLLGHGTGSIKRLFQASAAGETGASALVPDNPHNQTLAVGIQLGSIGIGLLYAMWIGHLLAFRERSVAREGKAGRGLAREGLAWIGLIVVLQNIVSCLFNSHLFDFTQGWTYVFGVGIAAGALARGQDFVACETAVRLPNKIDIASSKTPAE